MAKTMNYIIQTETENHIIVADTKQKAISILYDELFELFGFDECDRLMKLAKVVASWKNEVGYKLSFYKAT
jgi:hypothetical protein